ncbi:MAG TPA: DUF4383 domain-containing protein [Egibacteraceae bacterium]|jgi:hypothetical protein|nr:DUF4383 domain-containing protein [Egibacteraceae bacterium]
MLRTSAARKFALVFGIVYIAVGIVGFAVTGFSDWLVNTDERLLIFELNAFHNIVHLGIGGLLILGYFLPEESSTQGVNIGIGAFLLLAAFIGFSGAGTLQIISIDSPLAADNFLHLVSGIVAVAFGFSRVSAATSPA